jgi:hypothetical protein
MADDPGAPLSLEERVRLLEDKEEIREMIARYAYHSMRGGGDVMGSLFTEDGVFDARSPDGKTSDIRIEGRDNLTEFYNGLRPGGTNPMIHDLMIEFRGDEASGTCMLDAPCYTGERRGYLGYYEDEFRRVDGRWRFKARVFRFFQGSVNNT